VSASDQFDLAALSSQQRLELESLLLELERRQNTRLLQTMFPDKGPLRRELYPKHQEFFKSRAPGTPPGELTEIARASERVFMAGNRVGKTVAAGTEIAYHLTGEYPDWWEGHRFDKACR
jgi:hypothetical protein